MPSYDLVGKVKVILDEQTFDSGFNKREFVVTTDEKYPQDIKFECVKDKCSILDEYSVGQNVKVSFNMRGNEFKERYYVNLTCWKMEAADDDAVPAGAPAAASTGTDRPPIDQYQEPSDNVDDVLPF
jgi:single-strand DNA-binding protein